MRQENTEDTMSAKQRAELKRLTLVLIICTAIVLFAPTLQLRAPEALSYILYGLQALIGLGLLVLGSWVFWGLRQLRRRRR